jgi:biopolymer transport protein ExbD
MQTLNNLVSNMLFYLIVFMVAWSYMFKAMKSKAPNVTNAVKDAATKKALSFIFKLLK